MARSESQPNLVDGSIAQALECVSDNQDRTNKTLRILLDRIDELYNYVMAHGSTERVAKEIQDIKTDVSNILKMHNSYDVETPTRKIENIVKQIDELATSMRDIKRYMPTSEDIARTLQGDISDAISDSVNKSTALIISSRKATSDDDESGVKWWANKWFALITVALTVLGPILLSGWFASKMKVARAEIENVQEATAKETESNMTLIMDALHRLDGHGDSRTNKIK